MHIRIFHITTLTIWCLLTFTLLISTSPVQAQEKPTFHTYDLQRITTQLNHEDWIIQNAAIQQCLKYNITPAIPSLIKLLKNNSQHPWLRAQALTTIATLQPKPNQPLILSFTQSPDPILKKSAIQALSHFPDSKTDQTIQSLLKDKDQAIRLTALLAHTKHHQQSSWPITKQLTETITKESSPEQQQLAMENGHGFQELCLATLL